MNKKASSVEEHVLVTIGKIILFFVALLIALKFCSVTLPILFGTQNNGANYEGFKALNEIHQEIKHFDSEFGKVSKTISIKTNSATIIGFDKKKEMCVNKDMSCICMCSTKDCSELNEELKKKYCKEFSYNVDSTLIFQANEEYQSYTIALLKGSSGEYRVGIITK